MLWGGFHLHPDGYKNKSKGEWATPKKCQSQIRYSAAATENGSQVLVLGLQIIQILTYIISLLLLYVTILGEGERSEKLTACVLKKFYWMFQRGKREQRHTPAIFSRSCTCNIAAYIKHPILIPEEYSGVSISANYLLQTTHFALYLFHESTLIPRNNVWGLGGWGSVSGNKKDKWKNYCL